MICGFLTLSKFIKGEIQNDETFAAAAATATAINLKKKLIKIEFVQRCQIKAGLQGCQKNRIRVRLG